MNAGPNHPAARETVKEYRTMVAWCDHLRMLVRIPGELNRAKRGASLAIPRYGLYTRCWSQKLLERDDDPDDHLIDLSANMRRQLEAIIEYCTSVLKVVDWDR